MSMFNASIRHGRSLDDARARLDMAVRELNVRFGKMVRSVEWSSGREAVTVLGAGFRLEMRVDDQDLHVSGDIPILGALLGKSVEAGVKQIVQQAFGKIPGSP